MDRFRRSCSAAVLLAVVALTISGCSDDDPSTKPNPQSYRLPFPDTPDQLMANFQTAVATRDLDAYRDEILADQYEFILQNQTVQQFGLPRAVLDRSAELAITQKMFSGQPNEDGRVLAAIDFQIFQPHGPWMPVPAADGYFQAIPGALVRNFDLVIVFDMQGDLDYEIQGQQLFYAIPDIRLRDGNMVQCYRLRGQLDACSLVSPDQTAAATWGSVKAQYR